MRALVTGLAACFFCPLIPVFLGLGAILSLGVAGFGLVAAAAFLTDGLALDLVFRAAALAEPALADGTADGFFSAALAGAGACLGAAGLAAAGADLGAAALGAGAGVFEDAGFSAAGAEAAFGAAAGVLAVAGFFSAGFEAPVYKCECFQNSPPITNLIFLGHAHFCRH